MNTDINEALATLKEEGVWEDIKWEDVVEYAECFGISPDKLARNRIVDYMNEMYDQTVDQWNR